MWFVGSVGAFPVGSAIIYWACVKFDCLGSGWMPLVSEDIEWASFRNIYIEVFDSFPFG